MMDRFLAYPLFAGDLRDIPNHSTAPNARVRVTPLAGPSGKDSFHPHA